MYGQLIINAVCNKCGENMPKLRDDGVWDTSICKCGNWYNVTQALANGGKLVD